MGSRSVAGSGTDPGGSLGGSFGGSVGGSFGGSFGGSVGGFGMSGGVGSSGGTSVGGSGSSGGVEPGGSVTGGRGSVGGLSGGSWVEYGNGDESPSSDGCRRSGTPAVATSPGILAIPRDGQPKSMAKEFAAAGIPPRLGSVGSQSARCNSGSGVFKTSRE